MNLLCGCNGDILEGNINPCAEHKEFWVEVEQEANKFWKDLTRRSFELGKAIRETKTRELIELLTNPELLK